MRDMYISDSILYVGADDKTLDIFESQYPIPNGVSYNSYVILDEKVAVMDTVDKRATDTWFENLARELGDRKPDYLVVSHMEPDHAANIKNFAERYPETKIVGNAKTFAMMGQFFEMDLTERKVLVKEGETLSLGSHTLQFFMAPMVHWPEVMVTYEQSEKILLLLKYCRQVRRAGTGTVKEGFRTGYPDDLPAARTDLKRKPGLLH